MRDREDVKRQILEGRRGGRHAPHPVRRRADHPPELRRLRAASAGRRATRRSRPSPTAACSRTATSSSAASTRASSEITFSHPRPQREGPRRPGRHQGRLRRRRCAGSGERSRIAPRARGAAHRERRHRRQPRQRHASCPRCCALFYGMGVKEFDLLQVVPFGRAFTDGRDTLFYDLAEMRPFIQEALAFSKRPDVHIWMNRFPPQHLEGYEHLIQDPYKLNDEVRGRQGGVRAPARRGHLARLPRAGALQVLLPRAAVRHARGRHRHGRREALRGRARRHRVGGASSRAVFGGDPASARRSKEEAENGGAERQAARCRCSRRSARPASLEALVEESTANDAARVRAGRSRRRREVVARFPAPANVELELDDYAGLAEALAGARQRRRRSRAAAGHARRPRRCSAIDAPFEVTVDPHEGDRRVAARRSPERSPRIALRQPNYERLTEAAANDVDLADFFARFTHARAGRQRTGVHPRAGAARGPAHPRHGDDDAGRRGSRSSATRGATSSRATARSRCAARRARISSGCDGMHVNYVRAHGYGVMRPVES